MRRTLSHPEARQAADAARAAARIDETRPAADAFTGYLLMLYAPSGARFGRDVKTYAEACILRDEEMKTGRYEKAWIFQKPILKRQLVDKRGSSGSGGEREYGDL